jgi:protein involved in polysaccharide export with SLBB domain
MEKGGGAMRKIVKRDGRIEERRITEFRWIVVVLALSWGTAIAPARGQTVTSPATSPTDASTQSTVQQVVPPQSATSTAIGMTSGALNQMPRDEESLDESMPASALIQLVESDPEVMVEVKPLVADALSRRGLTVTAESLSDEQVYAQLASSAELRQNVTSYLCARGYLTEDQIEAARERAATTSLKTRSGVIQRTTISTPAPGADASQELYRQGTSENLLGLDGSEWHRNLPSAPYESVESDTTQTRPAQPNVTDEPNVLRRPAPYNLRSLRDLYTQVPDSPEHLRRFGSDVFVMRWAARSSSGASDRNGGIGAMDVPVGPDYVLGPGDELSISLWGGVSENLLRVVTREGAVSLPEAGLVQVAGLTLERAQAVIQNALQPQYRNAHAAVTVSRFRSIRLFVVGDVQRPGSYEISSIASPVSALYEAGGPTAAGSLRVLRHIRGGNQIGEIDLYDFMLHGFRSSHEKLETGDTLLVPPVGPQVAVFGAVKRPAIYELRSEKSLAEVLEDAGTVTAAGAIAHITVERVVANRGREEIGLNADAGEDPSVTMARLAAFEVHDGDRVHIATVAPFQERVVYLAGHVVRPGKIAYRDNMRLSDVLRSYNDMLPEPADTAEVVRLVAPDMHPETIEFNVADVMIGNTPLTLQAFDTIRVFGRYERDAPTVTVRGEVQRPGSYPLFEGMSAAQLVRAAGGFKRDALLSRADLTSYDVVSGSKVSVSRRDVSIGAAVLKTDDGSDVLLKVGDVLTIHQITGWNDIGAAITIEGEVAHPGTYGLQEGEHLSDLLKRAGGFRTTAYPEGAVLTRAEVAALEEKSREELIRQIETSSAAARLAPRVSESDQAAESQAIQQQQDQVIARLKSHPASGRLVIHIGEDIASWAGTSADIEVRRGDVLRIPKRPSFVLVSGQVYNSSAITLSPGKTAEWYLQRAGGPTEIANRKEIFVIRASGEVIGRRSGAWHDDVLSTKLNAGDTVVVPQKIVGSSHVWRALLGTAQMAASIAITTAAFTGL